MKKLVAILIVLFIVFGIINTAYSNGPATPSDLSPIEIRDYTVTLSNLRYYSIVALNNATLNGHIRGSIWVGGTLHGSEWKFVDDGALNRESPSDSYVHNNESQIQFKGRTNDQGLNSYFCPSDASIAETRSYWQNLITTLGNNDTWIYLEPDANGHVDLYARNYQCAGSDESIASIERIYWTDATSVTMEGLAGHLIAPYADVTIVTCNHCGSIVAKNITSTAESHINYWTPSNPPTPTPEVTPTPTPLTVTKVLNGEIWSLRCDTMDNTKFKAGGGYWMADINNPAHNTSKEGHRSNHCGNRENWVLFVSEEGKAISLYQLKSGSTGGTLPSIVYRAPADLRSIPEGQFIYDPTNPDDVMTKRLIEEVFIPQNAMPFEEINLVEGQRLFWISQNGKQVWHHTGVLKKTTPRFAFIINGEPYTLGVGETITLTEVEEGLLEIEEIATSNYKMVEITNDGEGNYVVINEIDPPDKPTPTPPPPVVTPTPTPSPTPEETESPSPTPEETETPSSTPEETESPSPTPEETETPSPTPEETESPSPTPEETESPSPTPEETETPSPTPEETETPSSTPEETETPSPTPEVTDEPSPSPEPSEEPSSSPEPSEEPSPSPEVSESPSPSPEVSESPSPSPEVSESPSPSPEISESPSPSPEVSESPSPSPEVSESPSPSPEVSESPSPSPEVSESPSPSPSPSPEVSESPSPSPEIETCGLTIKKIVTNYELLEDDVIFFFMIHSPEFEEDEYIEITVDKTTGIGAWSIDDLKPGKYSVTEVDIPKEFELVSSENITLYIVGNENEFVFENKLKEPEPSPSPEVSESPSPSPEVSESPSPEVTETPTPSPEVTSTPIETESPSPTPEETESPTLPPTTATPSEVPSETPTPTPTLTPTPTVTTSPIPSEVPTPTPTPSEEPTPTVIVETPTPTPVWTTPPTTVTPSEVPSEVPTSTPTPTPTPTVTTSPIPSETPTQSPTPTPTPTETPIPTKTITIIKQWNGDQEHPATVSIDMYENEVYIGTYTIAEKLEIEVYDSEDYVYTWREHEVNGYKLKKIIQNKTTIIFINAPIEVPKVPEEIAQPKIPTGTISLIEIEDYKTSLGLDILINHVGDCFD